MNESPLDDMFFDKEPKPQKSVFHPSDSLPEEWQLIRDERWEERVVKHLLKVGQQPELSKILLQESKALTGTPKLLFSAYKELTGFPIFLHCRKIPFVYRTTYEVGFKNPKKLLFAKAFYELEPEVPGGEELRGLVFEWLHAGSPFKIVHNVSHITRHCGYQVSFPGAEVRGMTEVLVVQDLNTFLVGMDWIEEAEDGE